MKLYHGSLEVVSCPEIRMSDRTLDYGRGFYATTSYEQAEAWVKRKQNQGEKRNGYVNVYEYDKVAEDELKCLFFNQPSDEWVDFVMRNRTEVGYVHDYDTVYGPVANDRVYAAFALYEGGILDKQSLIRELKTYKLVDQYLFHTQRSLQALTFIKAEEVMI